VEGFRWGGEKNACRFPDDIRKLKTPRLGLGCLLPPRGIREHYLKYFPKFGNYLKSICTYHGPFKQNLQQNVEGNRSFEFGTAIAAR
jgi:hypothetical protein